MHTHPAPASGLAGMQVYSSAALAAKDAVAGIPAECPSSFFGTVTTEMEQLAYFGHAGVHRTKEEKAAAKQEKKEATEKMQRQALAQQQTKFEGAFTESLKEGCTKQAKNPQEKLKNVSVPWTLPPGGNKLEKRVFCLGPSGRDKHDGQTTEEFVQEVGIAPWGKVAHTARSEKSGTIYMKVEVTREGTPMGEPVAISLCPPSDFAESLGKDKRGMDTKCMICFNTWQARKALGLSWEVEKAADDARKQKKKDDAAAAAAGEAMQTD